MAIFGLGLGRMVGFGQGVQPKSKCSWEAPFQHRHASFPSLDARMRSLCVQSTGMVGVIRSHTAEDLQHLRKAPKSAHTMCDTPLHNSTPIFPPVK